MMALFLGGPWLIWSLSGPLRLAPNFLAALQYARELSLQTEDWFGAPSAIQRVGTGQYLDARAIMDCWRELGWTTPP